MKLKPNIKLNHKVNVNNQQSNKYFEQQLLLKLAIALKHILTVNTYLSKKKIIIKIIAIFIFIIVSWEHWKNPATENTEYVTG